jgi:TIR domain
MPSSSNPVEVFYSYAHEDASLRDTLEKHLSLLSRQGLIKEWHDRRIVPGTNWAQAIDEHMERASVILLLISADFLASDYCFGIEMKRALQRHQANEARVIPILLRPVDWNSAPFAHLQALPTGAKPITTWRNWDEAFADVAASIRKVIEGLVTAEPQDAPSSPPGQVSVQPPSQSQGKRIGIIVGMGLLLLILVGAGVFTLFSSTAPSHNPYSNMGTLVLNDPLHDNSRGYKWDEGSDIYGFACGFRGGAYHITAGGLNPQYNICRPEAASLDFSDLTYEVKITIAAGDIGGIVFRDNPTTNFRYVFTVDIQGNYTLSKDDGSGHFSTLRSGVNDAIDNGPAPSNLLAIVATGNMISLYANNTQLAQVQDTSYKRGQIGIYANKESDIIASDVRVWKP